MNTVQTLEAAELEHFIGGSFKDLTRVAESSPALWVDIFLNNKKNIIDMCQLFIENLNTFQMMLEREDSVALGSYLDVARKAKTKLKH